MSRAYIVSAGPRRSRPRSRWAAVLRRDRTAARALFVARRQSYHGNTLGALAVGGNEWRRRQFGPL